MKKLFVLLTALLPSLMFGQAMDEILADFIKYHDARIEIAITDFDDESPWQITCRGFDNTHSSNAKKLEKEKAADLLALLGKLREAAPAEGHEDFFNHRISESSAFMQLAETFSAISKVNRPRELWDSLKAETRRALDENIPVLETSTGKVYRLAPFARIFKDYTITSPTEDFVYFEYPLPLDVRAKITFYPMSMTQTPKVIYLDASHVFFEGKLYHNTDELRDFLIHNA